MINSNLILDVEQGSDAWLNSRLGIPTASCFSKIVTPAKGQLSTSNVDYMAELIAEHVTGEYDNFVSKDMQNGIDQEVDARLMYEEIYNTKVEQVGMIFLDDRKIISCSPDGLINRTMGFEVKSPKLKTHIKYKLLGILPPEYKVQVQGSMWVTGLKEWVFMSFHYQFLPFIITVKRDDAYIEKMSKAILEFSAKLEDEKAKLTKQNEAA